MIWIQKNPGHDLQTFRDLAKIKCLGSRKRNFSAVKKIQDEHERYEDEFSG